MLGVAVFTAPVQWLTHNPVLVYNVAFLASYVLAGMGAFLLARSLWGRTDAALLAGLAFALSPYRMGQVTHLQMLMTGWVPLSLWALQRYVVSGSRRMLAAFAAAFLLQALSNGYFLYFLSIAVAVAVACELIRPRLPRVRLLADLAGAGVFILLLLSPFAWMYLHVQRENAFERRSDDLVRYAARWSDYFTVPPGGWSWGGRLPLGASERHLYPGLFALGFGLIGVASALGHPRGAEAGDADSPGQVHGETDPGNQRADAVGPDEWRRNVVTYVLVTAVAFSVSLGPGAWRPYGVLVRVVPGFSGMRVPARMGLLVHLGLAVLAAAGAARVFSRLPRPVALA
ncbi:MAG: hypothetical protein ACJ79O_25450, partial [Myxococcales bacterium]